MGYTYEEKDKIRQWKINLPTTTVARKFETRFVPMDKKDEDGFTLYECRISSNDDHHLTVAKDVSL
jgi:hypothetical protein